MFNPRKRVLTVVVCALTASCSSDAGQPLGSAGRTALVLSESEWSEPENVGPPINTAGNEMNAAFSHDDLSIYFTTDREGGLGGLDVWVSRRDCLECPWDEPANLGAPVNSEFNDAGPRVSIDGQLLFFQSNRPGGFGAFDIYLATRQDPNDDLGWTGVVNVGSGVNTALLEQAAAYLQSSEDGPGNLYFNRGPQGGQDIYVGAVSRQGVSTGEAVLVPELSGPGIDQHATVRRDGREIFIASIREGGLGIFDLYTSTRASVHDAWSVPAALPSLNTVFSEQQPSLSRTGRMLLFASNRPGGEGLNDLWIVTRSPSAK